MRKCNRVERQFFFLRLQNDFCSFSVSKAKVLHVLILIIGLNEYKPIIYGLTLNYSIMVIKQCSHIQLIVPTIRLSFQGSPANCIESLTQEQTLIPIKYMETSNSLSTGRTSSRKELCMSPKYNFTLPISQCDYVVVSLIIGQTSP